MHGGRDAAHRAAATVQSCRSMPDVWQNASERIRHPASRCGTLMPNMWATGIRSAASPQPTPRDHLARSLTTSADHTEEPEMTATLAPSAKVRSARSSSPAPTTVALSIISDANMAWMLADAANVCLTGHERTMAFVELGCGEHHLAIERILSAVMADGMMLPVAIFDWLTGWLDGYVGSPEEPQLRTMLAEVRAQQFGPVPLRSQRTQCAEVRRTAAPACSTNVARRRLA